VAYDHSAHGLEPLGVSDGTRLAVITLACIACGALLHKAVEAPFLALRDRLVPSNFRGDRAPALGAAVTP
jgi:peptidoglycan/LPS O-acetylase OafA/YrhL